MPATALWIGLPGPEMPGEAAGRAAWFMFLGLTPAASICRTVVAGNTLDTPRLRRCAFAGAVVRLGAVRMAATRRRSRYLGDQGSTGPPAMAPRRLRKAGAAFAGYSRGRRRPPAIPQAGRQAGAGWRELHCEPTRGRRCVFRSAKGYPIRYAGLRGLRTLLQQTPARLKRGEGLSADWPKDSGDLAVARGGGAARVC